MHTRLCAAPRARPARARVLGRPCRLASSRTRSRVRTGMAGCVPGAGETLGALRERVHPYAGAQAGAGPRAQEAVAGMRYRIVIEASKGPVRWFEVPASSFTVGRAKDNQVCLAGDDFLHVSRTHIKVEYRAGRLWVCDMSSSKGTLMESGGAGTGASSGAPVALAAGKSYTLPEGRKVNLGGCVDLTFQVLLPHGISKTRLRV